TMRSVCAHTQDRVREGLLNEPMWTQKYQLPSFSARGPDPQPLRRLDSVDARPLTVHINPDEAAARTAVKFVVGNYELPKEYCYPLNHNHDTVHLEPQRHLMLATS